MRYRNIRSGLFDFVTKYACFQTDGQTGTQNYNSQDRASIAARAVTIRNTDQVRNEEVLEGIDQRVVNGSSSLLPLEGIDQHVVSGFDWPASSFVTCCIAN